MINSLYLLKINCIKKNTNPNKSLSEKIRAEFKSNFEIYKIKLHRPDTGIIVCM